MEVSREPVDFVIITALEEECDAVLRRAIAMTDQHAQRVAVSMTMPVYPYSGPVVSKSVRAVASSG